jgi:hypothetical protein
MTRRYNEPDEVPDSRPAMDLPLFPDDHGDEPPACRWCGRRVDEGQLYCSRLCLDEEAAWELDLDELTEALSRGS